MPDFKKVARLLTHIGGAPSTAAGGDVSAVLRELLLEKGPLIYNFTDAAAGNTITERPLYSFPANTSIKVTKVEFIPEALSSAHAANFGAIELWAQDGASGGDVKIAEWSTDSAKQGTLTAGTPVSLVFTVANQILLNAASKVLYLKTTKGGTGVVLSGTLQVRWEYIDQT